MHIHVDSKLHTHTNIHTHTCTAGRAFLHKVSQLAVTDERALCVLTITMQTDVGVQVALVDILRIKHA